MMVMLSKDWGWIDVTFVYFYSCLIVNIAIKNEFFYGDGKWNYQQQDYGDDFVPKEKQTKKIKLYDDLKMPRFANKEDLMN